MGKFSGTLEQMLDRYIKTALEQEQNGYMSNARDWWKEALILAPPESLERLLAEQGIARCENPKGVQ